MEGERGERGRNFQCVHLAKSLLTCLALMTSSASTRASSAPPPSTLFLIRRPDNPGSVTLLGLRSPHSVTWNALHLCPGPMSSRQSPFSFIPTAPGPVCFTECFSNFLVHTNHLEILLKCSLFQKENLRAHLANKPPGEAVGPGPQ